MTSRNLRHRQLHLLLVVITLLTTSLSTIAPQSSPASAAQPLCLEGKIWDEEAETCIDLVEENVPTETPQPTAEPTDEPTATVEPTEEPEPPVRPTEEADIPMDDEAIDDAELVPADEDTAAITMFARSCPNGFDLQRATADERNAACVGSAVGTSFSLDVDYVPYGSVLASGSGNGEGWVDLASGTATIMMVAPDTHSGPGMARCVELKASGEQPFIDFFFNSYQSGLSVELDPFDAWHCYAFFNELPTGSVTIALHDCDRGVGLAGTPVEILSGICNEMLPNVVFTLDHDVIGTSTTTTSDFSTAIFHRVPEGTGRVRIDAPEDYGQHRVFCETIGPEGQTLSQFQQVDVGTDLSIAVTFDDLETTFCDWFTGEDPQMLPTLDVAPDGSPIADSIDQPPTNDPAADDDAAIAPSGDNSARITMYSHSCRSDFDIRNATVSERISGCQGWVSRTTYRLDVDGVSYGTIVSPDGIGGNSWTEVATGIATVTSLTPPMSTGPGAAYCETSALMVEQRNVAFTFNSFEPAFRIELETDDIWYCNTYFNELPTGSVTATLLECPADLNILAIEPDTLKSSCRGFLPNVEFMLFHDESGISITYTSDFSRAIFNRVPEGTGRMRMSVPEGYAVPRVFCETIGPEGQTLHQYDQAFVGNDASIAVSFDDLETTFCNWYTVRNGSSFDQPDQSLDDQSFPIGTPITDQPIIGIEDIEDAEQPLPTPTPTLESGIGSEVESIEDIDTVALPDDSPGKVTIIVSRCPDGFEAADAMARDFNLACPYIKEDIVEFSLTDSSSAFVLSHTEPGLPLVEFETVAPGVAEVTAAIPIGVGEPAVFCQTIPPDGGAASAYTRQTVLEGGVLQLPVEPVSQTICDWFIVPFDAD